MASISFKSVTIPLRISYGMAIEKLPTLNIELLKMFSDQTVVGKLSEVLHVQDDKCLELLQLMCECNIKRRLTPEELDELDGVKMDEFRTAFWEAIENFSGAHRKPLIQQIRAEVLASLQKVNLNESSTNSLQEQESTPGSTP